HDHLSASTYNLLEHKPSYFDRSVYYDNLTLASVQELSKLANDVGMNALTVVNKTALALQKLDENSRGRDYRINFGVFNYNAVHRTDAPIECEIIEGDQDAYHPDSHSPLSDADVSGSAVVPGNPRGGDGQSGHRAARRQRRWWQRGWRPRLRRYRPLRRVRR